MSIGKLIKKAIAVGDAKSRTKRILKLLGIYDSLADFEYPGLIRRMEIVINIPASAFNYTTLYGLIEIQEVRDYYGNAFVDSVGDKYATDLYFEEIFPKVIPNEEYDYLTDNEGNPIYNRWRGNQAYVDKYVNDPNNPEYDFFRDYDIIAGIMNKRPFSASNKPTGQDLYYIKQWYQIDIKNDDYNTMNSLPAPINGTWCQTSCGGRCAYAYQVNYHWFKNASYYRQKTVVLMGIDLVADIDLDPCDNSKSSEVVTVILFVAIVVMIPEGAWTFSDILIEVGLVTMFVAQTQLLTDDRKTNQELMLVGSVLVAIGFGVKAFTVESASTYEVAGNIINSLSYGINAFRTYKEMTLQDEMEDKLNEMFALEDKVKRNEKLFKFTTGSSESYHVVSDPFWPRPTKQIESTLDSMSIYTHQELMTGKTGIGMESFNKYLSLDGA